MEFLSNFIFGIIGFALIFSIIGKAFVSPIVNEVEKDSPAYVSGLIKDDKIIKIDNEKINNFSDIGIIINLYKNEAYKF